MEKRRTIDEIKTANQPLGHTKTHTAHTHTLIHMPRARVQRLREGSAKLLFINDLLCGKPNTQLHLLSPHGSALTHFLKQKLRRFARNEQSPCSYPCKSTFRRQTELVVVGCDFRFCSNFASIKWNRSHFQTKNSFSESNPKCVLIFFFYDKFM